MYKEITTEASCVENIDVRFQHEYLSVALTPEGEVDLRLRDLTLQEVKSIACSHVIAADGAYSSVREDLGKSHEEDVT